MSAIKKAVKSVGKFLRKNWRKIALVAAVVFTAGLAAAGTGAFSTVMGSKGLLTAIGSTLKTGVVAIGGTLGIGGGVGVNTSLVAGASSTVAANAAAGIGTTLLNGAGAQALGFGKLAAATPGSALAGGATAPAAAGPGTAAWNGSMAGGTGATNASGYMTAPWSGSAGSIAAGGEAAGAGAAAGGVTSGIVPKVVEKAAGGGFLNSAVGSALVSGGLGAISSYMAASAQEEDEAINAMYGVSPREGDTSLTPAQMRFTTPVESRNSWRPRLMYDA